MQIRTVQNEPIILAVETALSKGSLAILKGERELDSLIGSGKSLRSEDLLQKIKNILERNDLQIRDISLIAVSTGPGSFTGIRVGLATAQALSFAVNCPVIGVSVLEALAFGFHHGYGIISVTPSVRNLLFWQEFEPDEFLKDGGAGAKKKVFTGTLEDLIENLNKNSHKTIIAVSHELKEISVFLDKQLKTRKDLFVASDNVAYLTALFSLKKYKTEDSTKLEIYPEYILET